MSDIKFHVNYYVGALLAQGGDAYLEGTMIRFSPTSAMDRAMGAKDVEIPFHQIRAVNYAGGALGRTFKIKTDDRIHKFEGGETKEFWELLEKVLREKGMAPIIPKGSIGAPIESATYAAPSGSASGTLACHQCSKPVQVGFMYCPFCAARLKSVCGSCQRAVETSWSACAYCGRKVNAFVS